MGKHYHDAFPFSNLCSIIKAGLISAVTTNMPAARMPSATQTSTQLGALIDDFPQK
jgi:hypothetical protein